MAKQIHKTPRWKTVSAEQEGHVHVEPTPRQYRIFESHHKQDSPLMLSKAACLVWEASRGPLLAFPKDDIKWATDGKKESGLVPSMKKDGPSKMASKYYDLVSADGSRVEQVAWTYDDNTRLTRTSSQQQAPSPSNLITLETSKFASVWEEDEPMLGHVKNPYHRVDAVPTARRIQVYALSKSGKEVLLADTVNSVENKGRAVAIFETALPTRWYLPVNALHVNGKGTATMHPPPACQLEAYPKDGLETTCPYKGVARYHSITLAEDGTQLDNIAWAYPENIPALDLRGLVAFWTPGNDNLKLFVDGEQVTA